MKIQPEVAAFVGNIDFDPDALLRKYLGERDKRLREDGVDQYVEVKAEFSRYIEDPYVEPGFTRAPVFDDVEFAIVGGGFGGLLMGARLREAGFESLRIIETGGDVGGTWYWNRYPGAMCDVESYCYLPLLEELGYMPKHKYSFGPEILEHSRQIARHYRLYDNALFQTAISELRWDESDQRWIISTNRGDRSRPAMSQSPTARCIARNCRASPASTNSKAIHPYQSLGLSLHGWRQLRQSHRLEGQARRNHRHRCHRGSVHSPSWRTRKAALRFPADSLLDRRTQQRRDRSGMGGFA